MNLVLDPVTAFEINDLRSRVTAFLTDNEIATDIIYKHFVSQTFDTGTQATATTYTNIYIDACLKGTVTAEDFERDIGMFERIDAYFRIPYEDFSSISYDPHARDLIITDWSSAYAATYSDADTFTVSGDQTSVFTKSIELKVNLSGSYVSETVVSSSHAGGTTTVNVLNGNLTADLTQVFAGKIYEVAKPTQKEVTGRSAAIGIDIVAKTYFKIAGRLV